MYTCPAAVMPRASPRVTCTLVAVHFCVPGTVRLGVDISPRFLERFPAQARADWLSTRRLAAWLAAWLASVGYCGRTGPVGVPRAASRRAAAGRRERGVRVTDLLRAERDRRGDPRPRLIAGSWPRRWNAAIRLRLPWPLMTMHGLGAGQGLVRGSDPQAVQDPPVAGVAVEPGGLALVPEAGDPDEQGLEFEESAAVGPGVLAHA